MEDAGSLEPSPDQWLDLEAAAENQAVGAKENSLPHTHEAATAIQVTHPQIPANVHCGPWAQGPSSCSWFSFHPMEHTLAAPQTGCL